MDVQEYVLELLSQNQDLKDGAMEYTEAAKSLVKWVRKELGKGNVRQTAEKL